MIYVLLRFTVEDLAKWKPVFEEAGALRRSFGSIGIHAYNKTDNPNEVVILGKFEDGEKARQLYQSQELRDIMQRAGIKGPPEITFLNEVVSLPA